MLKKMHRWSDENLVQGWFVGVALMTVVHLILIYYCKAVLHQATPPGMYLLFGAMIVSGPTTAIISRCSMTQSGEKPIAPRQERSIANLAIVLAFIAGLCFPAFFWTGRSANSPSAPLVNGILTLTTMSLTSSVLLGYATRHTVLGRIAMATVPVSFGLFLVYAIAVVAWRRFVG